MSAPTTTGRVTARAAQAAETRQRLIAAAVQLFSEHSYDDVAVADIPKVAGVAHGLLFHYFGSKRGIYLEAMRGAAEQLYESFKIRPGLPPAAQIRRALASHLRYLATHRGLALRLVLGGRGADPEAWEVFEAGRWRALQTVGALLGLHRDSAALRMMGRAAVSAIDEVSVFWLNNGQPFEVDAMVGCMVQMIASGLRAAATLDPTLDVDAAVHTLLDEATADIGDAHCSD